MIEIYNLIIYKPLLNILVFGYNIIPGHSIGLVIIILTIVVRAALAPQVRKTIESQKRMSDLQPRLKEIKNKHKNDKVAEGQAVMQLYKDTGVNPLSSCLPILIQIPLFIALYQVFSTALKAPIDGAWLYGFVSNPGQIQGSFLHFFNLANFSWILTIIAGATQYYQSKMMMPKDLSQMDETQRAMQTQTMYVMPIITIVIAFSTKMPGGVLLYWVVNSLFQIVQQRYILKK